MLIDFQQTQLDDLILFTDYVFTQQPKDESEIIETAILTGTVQTSSVLYANVDDF